MLFYNFRRPIRLSNASLSKATVQTEIHLYEIACQTLARGLQLACERLAEYKIVRLHDFT